MILLNILLAERSFNAAINEQFDQGNIGSTIRPVASLFLRFNRELR